MASRHSINAEQDVAVNSQSKNELAKHGSLMLRAVEHVRDAVLLTQVSADQHNQRIVYSNPAFTSLTGYGADEVVGLSPEILHGPETCDDAVLSIRQSAIEGASFRVGLTQYKKSGSTVHVECRSDPIFGPNGHVSHWIYFLREVPSGAKSSERIAEQRRELFDAMRRNVAGELAAVTIHESQQPLYAIGNLAAACRNTINSGDLFDKSKIIHWLDTITNTVGDAKSLLQQLRGFADDSVPNNTAMNMSEVVSSIAEMLDEDLRHTGIKFVNDFQCDCMVDVDAAQIRQVIAELVLNARNCLMDSSSQPKHVKLTTWYENDSCHICVEDNGPGVPQEALGEIFKPFYSKSADRLGLGLSFCKSAVAAHGGTLFAKLNDTGGFSVHFTIPGTPRSANVER